MPAVNAEKFLAYGQLFISAPVAQDSIVSDLHEAVGQDVQEKATDELRGVQGHELDRIVVVTVSVPESDLIIFYAYESVVGYGHPMSISAQVFHDRLSIVERGFAVNNPFLIIKLIEHGLEGLVLFEAGDVSGKRQFSFFPGLFEIGQELAPK